MTGHFINLTDGSRLEVKINFGTLYYLQQCKADELAKKIERRRKKGKKDLPDDVMEFAAKVIYATLRSNGQKVTFDEALELMPPFLDELEMVIDVYNEYIEKLKKKQKAKQNMKKFQSK